VPESGDFYPRAFDKNTNRLLPRIIQGGDPPIGRSVFVIPHEFQFKICAGIHPLQTTLMSDWVLWAVEYPCRYDLLRLIPRCPMCPGDRVEHRHSFSGQKLVCACINLGRIQLYVKQSKCCVSSKPKGQVWSFHQNAPEEWLPFAVHCSPEEWVKIFSCPTAWRVGFTWKDQVTWRVGKNIFSDQSQANLLNSRPWRVGVIKWQKSVTQRAGIHV
jgi:hypothetical protein